MIVGTGLAAVRAAEALCDAGSSAPIVMVGAERVLPYDRPPLSNKLQNNAAVRTAVDPVTQRPVDKAVAVIGKTDSGKVLYFESADTFARYGRE